MEAKFFRPFRVLHPIRKQVYKLELLRKKKIYNVFHVLLLKQDTIKKGRVDKKIRQMEFDVGHYDNEEWEVEAIWESTVYVRKSKSGHLSGLYYLVSWRGYSEDENTWEPASAVLHLKKLISSFHKNHPNKLTATSPTIDIISLMVRLIIKPIEPTKEKQE